MENRATPERPFFNKVILIGVGLIGGSFALSLKKAKAVAHIVGLDRHGSSPREASATQAGDITITTSQCRAWINQGGHASSAPPPGIDDPG